MALQTANIFADVAALTISGVTVNDLSALKQAVLARDCPIMFPDVDRMILGSKSLRQTFGGPLGGSWLDHTTCLWRYFHCMAGEGRGLKDIYPALIPRLDAIKLAIMEGAYALSDAVPQEIDMTQIGSVVGPNAATFYGLTISVRFQQIVHP